MTGGVNHAVAVKLGTQYEQFIKKEMQKVFDSLFTNCHIYTVIPRLTKIIRSGITFVSRNLR